MFGISFACPPRIYRWYPVRTCAISVPVARKPKSVVDAERLAGFKLLERFAELFEPLNDRRRKDPRELDSRRRFDARTYFSIMLFTLINPVIDSMRGLCAISKSAHYQKKTGLPQLALSTFSDAQAVFDPAVLRGVLREIIASRRCQLPRDLRNKLGPVSIEAIDSTIWEALGRMSWAPWRDQFSTRQKALRLHLRWRLFNGGGCADASVTPARECERRTLRHELLEPDVIYVGDRYYSGDYTLLERIGEIGASFVVRLQDMTVIEELEKLPLTPKDKESGITHHLRVALGHRAAKDLGWRLVRIVRPNGTPLMLVTNLSSERLGPRDLCNIYRQRWAIEGFFRWVKCILPCRHWLAESQAGVTSQIYCALIAAMMLTERLGKLPTKRQMEAIRWWMLGWMDDEEIKKALGFRKS